MKAIELYNYLDTIAPFNTASDWDNPGFLIGDKNARVTKCLVALDVTEHEIRQAVNEGAQLIVSHHPVIFRAKKSFCANDVCFEAAKNGIGVISAHTNLDKAIGGVNDTLCTALGLPYEKTSPDQNEGYLNICTPECPMGVKALAELTAQKLNAHVRFVHSDRSIAKIAVCSGAGADMSDSALSLGCDALITGDASYHDFLSAEEMGISLLAAGHFETEVLIVEHLIALFTKAFPEVDFMASSRKNPIAVTGVQYGI